MTLKQRLAAWFCDFICPLFDLYSETGTLYLVSQQRGEMGDRTRLEHVWGLFPVLNLLILHLYVNKLYSCFVMIRIFTL